MVLAEPLRQTLVRVAELCAPATDPWWVISSAAVALHGVAVDDVRDVDVLMSCRDAADTLARSRSMQKSVGGNELFRSEVFGIWSEPPHPVEIFGGFEFAHAGRWTRVVPASRKRIEIAGHALFVPAREELRAMLIGFGRPKDLARACLL
jgi:hypothetical protein